MRGGGGSEVRRESGGRRLAREGEKDVLVKDISDTVTRRLASQLSPTWEPFPVRAGLTWTVPQRYLSTD